MPRPIAERRYSGALQLLREENQPLSQRGVGGVQALADVSHQAGIGGLQCLEFQQEVGPERRPGTRGQRGGLPFFLVVLGRLLTFKTRHAPPVTPWFCTIFLLEKRL